MKILRGLLVLLFGILDAPFALIGSIGYFVWLCIYSMRHIKFTDTVKVYVGIMRVAIMAAYCISKMFIRHGWKYVKEHAMEENERYTDEFIQLIEGI